MVALNSNVSEQLSRLGLPAEQVGAQLGQMSTKRLARLSKGLQVTSGQLTTIDQVANKYGAKLDDGRWNIPPALHNPSPKASRRARGRYAAPSYYRARPQRHSSSRNPFPGLLNKFTSRGVISARAIHKNADLRRSAEKQAGFQVILDGRTDGAVSVGAMTATGSSGGSTPQSFWDILMAMDQAVMEEATALGQRQMAGSDMWGSAAYGTTTGHTSTGGAAGYRGGMGGGGGVGEAGYFAGAAAGAGTSESSDPTDILTLNIKRMMDKRSQMYDLFNQVFNKHNESAKTAIGNMRA